MFPHRVQFDAVLFLPSGSPPKFQPGQHASDNGLFLIEAMISNVGISTRPEPFNFYFQKEPAEEKPRETAARGVSIHSAAYTRASFPTPYAT